MTEQNADRQNADKQGPDKQNPGETKAGSRFDRRFFLGLIVGVVVAAVIGVGVTAIARPDLFKAGEAGEATESEPMLGGVLLQERQVVTPDDFEATVLRSGRPELVLIVDTTDDSPSLEALLETAGMVWDGSIKYYYATDDASRQYLRELSVRTEEGPPVLAMFYQGKLVAAKSLLTDADTVALWITKSDPVRPTPTPTTAPAPTSTTVPAREPAVFRAFLSSMHDYVNQDPRAEYYVGEVILTAVDYQIDGFVSADQAITVPVNSNTALFSLVGNAFGGDATSFVLPGLSGQAPLAGLTYQIGWKGLFPGRDSDHAVPSYVVGDVKYFEMPIDSIDHLNDALYIGDIVLARNIDRFPDLSRRLMPCDGRELKTDYYFALGDLLGTRFGGNGTSTFALPDLTGSVPVEGATFYIVVEGLYPPHGDGIPVPTPTSSTTTTRPRSPALLRAFTTATDDRVQVSATADYYLGEVVLSAADYEIDGFCNAGKAVTLPVDSNQELFALMGNTFGGDATSFALPDLSGQLPIAGVTYQISTSGAAPASADKPTRSHIVGNIKYLEIPIDSIRDVGGYLHVGDIMLAKDCDGVWGLSKDLLPCDGKDVSPFNYGALFSLIGTRFGDYTTTFGLPDLTGASPIEGASYFIVVNGAAPPRR